MVWLPWEIINKIFNSGEILEDLNRFSLHSDVIESDANKCASHLTIKKLHQ